MAADAGEKTEAATPRRRSEAREKGQVPRSQDLTAAVLLLAGFATLGLLGPGLWRTMLAIMHATLGGEPVYDPHEVTTLAASAAVEVFKRLAPYLIILFFSMLVVLYAQVGPLLTWQPLMPSLSKLNPISGFKRLLSIQSLMLAVTNFGKLLVVGLVAYLTIAGSAAAVLYSSTLGFRAAFELGVSLTYDLGIRLAVALLVLALFDVMWQRYKHERDLRMTKEEVKDEFRNMEGDPQIKKRRRQVQLQMAMQRLGQAVPQADVVVTNPTHISIAIRYESETMAAPKVIAKGADQVAIRIRQLAKKHGIPIVERKPLARALFASVEVGHYIPDRFYRAIAEILAYVYELSGRTEAARRREPVA